MEFILQLEKITPGAYRYNDFNNHTFYLRKDEVAGNEIEGAKEIKLTAEKTK